MNPELKAASARIGEAVKTFFGRRLSSVEPRFYANDLRIFVNASIAGLAAPGSADRIMRDLRQRGEIKYMLLNRAKSFYLALPVTALEPRGGATTV